MSDALLRIQSLEFEGAGTYRTTTGKIPLSSQGRVLLAGEEGAGKSMLPEVMTLVLYGKGSPRMRKTGLVESSIVNASTGYSGTLEFESGFGTASRHVEITQAFRHKRLGSRYVINVDGQREEPDTKPEQKKLVKRLAPLSMGEWLGVVYLNQGAVHDLLAGTPSEKRDYLTSVFGLDFYDDLLESAKQEQKDLKAKSANAESLRQQFADLQDDLRETDKVINGIPAELEDDIKEAGDKLQRLSTKLGKLSSLKKTADKVQRVDDEIEQANGKGKEKTEGELSDTKSERDGIVAEAAQVKEALKSAKQKAKAYDSAKTDAENAAELVQKLKKKKKALKSELGGAPSENHLRNGIRLLEQGVERFDPESSIASVEEGSEKWVADLAKADALRATVSKLEKLRAKNVHVCPTCNQNVEESELDRTIEELSKEADDTSASAFHGFLLALLENGGAWWEGTLQEALEKAESALSAYVQLEKTTERLQDAQERLSEASERLESLTEPEDPQELSDKLSELQDAMEELDDRLEILSHLKELYAQRETLLSALEGIDFEEVEDRIERLRKKRESAQEAYDELLEEKAKRDQALATKRALNKQKKAVEEKIQEHADNALKIRHYELTLIPYFNSLRAAKVNSCVSVLETVLPVYVAAMSANQYVGSEIKLQISDDLKKVDLMLKAGKYSEWVSAVQSSGGQRRRFTLAIIAALREVSPRKANLMFFDEPFADLQGEGKLLFINRLVPTLIDRCEDLESVFVIAHDQEVLEAGNDAFDSVWLAERGPTGSKLLLDQRLSFIDGK